MIISKRAKNVLLAILGSLIVTAWFVIGCTETPEPPISPIPSPTTSPIMPPDHIPLPEVTDEDIRPLFQAVSRAMVNLGVLLPIESTTHFHQLKLIRQLRRVDTGEILLEASAMTNIIGTDYIPEPEVKFAAAWIYDIDLEAEFGIKEAKEYVKPVWVCIREPGDTEPCLCQMNPDDELTDCAEIVGQCVGKDGELQGEDSFCYTDHFTELPELFKQWLPNVFVERESK